MPLPFAENQVRELGQRPVVGNVYHLLVYDRAAGKLLDQTVYENRRDALRGRFAVEKVHRDADHNIEVVVVDAESEEDLHRTDGRYFLPLAELADRAADVFARRA